MRPDREYICGAATTSNAVFVVRWSDLTLLNTIQIGKYYYWVQKSSDGERAYVAVNGEDCVSVVDYTDATEVAEIRVNAGPMVMERRSVTDEILYC